ncbi:MAG: response regulator, partial [Proteobacteria bacterium]
ASTAVRPKASPLVLLVEDQPELRKLMRDILQEGGYRVIEAGSGPAALGLASNWPEPPALVITDVIMPDMTGPAFLRALEQLQGKCFPAMYVSGYPQTEWGRHGLEADSVSFLEKPFSRAVFLERVAAFFPA